MDALISKGKKTAGVAKGDMTETRAEGLFH